MKLQYAFSLSVFGTYFLLIFGLFALIIKNIYRSKASNSHGAGKALVFIALTIASLAHTWFYMFKYMAWSFANYELSLAGGETQDLLHRIASWLYDTSLFEEAWALVCFHPLNWWWSEQLCTFTVGAWTVFLAIEGNRYNVKHLWAYMLLGQIVAISVASNLFYLALVLSQPPPQEQVSKLTTGPKLWITVILSLATVAISPSTSRQTFLPNLLVMHALLFIPVIGSPSTSLGGPSARFSIDSRNLLRIVQLTAAIIHLRTVLAAVNFLKQGEQSAAPSMVAVAWTVLHSHPAQSSIGWDVIWTTISFVIWILARPARPFQGSRNMALSYLLLATPVSSVGVTAPYVLRPLSEPAIVKEE
ncbi:hypothetical protein GALMADRAFT_63750 [Galerina marginata CBS 339.88]|uniref:Uncharacterized protein n=1 Tax=Galerina marginata (strain CBS 339.88) TaxID=685588 RepID=A0A067TGK1_GALM3|nr:hypothetical protein GALMADRAFT_63750 [Galerina marginata CBS 339.88]